MLSMTPKLRKGLKKVTKNAVLRVVRRRHQMQGFSVWKVAFAKRKG